MLVPSRVGNEEYRYKLLEPLGELSTYEKSSVEDHL